MRLSSAKLILKALMLVFFFGIHAQAASFFNDRISVQGYLKVSGVALNDATGFPMAFVIKKNSTSVWCQTTASNVAVTKGIFNQTLTGNSNCQSLTNALDGNVFSHSSNSDVFTIDVIVDYQKNGFGGSDDTTFAGIDLVSVPLAIYSHYANTAQNALSLTGTLDIATGGTGATTAAAARTNLGLGTVAVLNTTGSATQVLRGDGTFGSVPTTSLAGDVSGTSAATSVDKIKNRAVSATAPTDTQVLTWNGGTSAWEPRTPAAAPVTSVAGRTGVVTLNSADIGDATDANTASVLVKRDASGNFSAGTITATLTGNATNVSGTVAVANGGTGATTAAAARTNLGVAASGANTDITTMTGIAKNSTGHIALATTGTATAYVLTNTVSIGALTTGQVIVFRPNVASGASPTINVDGLGAKPIFSALRGAALVANDMIANALIQAYYDGTRWVATLPTQYFAATTLNCGTNISAGAVVSCPTITAATVASGDIVQCTPAGDPGNGVTWSSFSNAGNIGIRLSCADPAGCTLTSRNWKCSVQK